MKTLDQIDAKLEKRVPISQAPFTINASGSYYLTQNLTVDGGSGITITVSDVTLDLNGFTISSTASPAAGTGVLISGARSNVTIRNGHIKGRVTSSDGTYTGGGFLDGIAGTTARNGIITEVSVSGCLSDGIDMGGDNSVTVERCVVRTVGGIGIRAGTVNSSTARDCGDFGIAAGVVANSHGECTKSGSGINATTATNSRGESESGTGLFAFVASNCYGRSTSSYGISAPVASSCFGASTSGVGLQANHAQNCVGQSSSGVGLIAGGTANSCHGVGSPKAMEAHIAIGCTRSGPNSTITASGGKFLGTP